MIALRDRLGVREIEGASAAGVAAMCALMGLAEAEARELARDFPLRELVDRDPDGPPRFSFDSLFGRAKGEVFFEQMNKVATLHTSGLWEVLRHDDSSRPLRSTWSHRLGLRVSVMRLRGVDVEQARIAQKNGKLVGLVGREMARGGGFDVINFPSEAATDLGLSLSALDRIPVAHSIVDSARHPSVFRVRIAEAPNGRDTLLFADGAARSTMAALRHHTPEQPTVLLSFGLDRKNPERQRQRDRDDLPGYHVIRLPSSEDTGLVAMMKSVDMRLDADQRVALFDLGLRYAEDFFETDAYEAYLERWSDLYAIAALEGLDMGPARMPSHPDPLAAVRNAVSSVLVSKGTPVTLGPSF